MIALELSPIEVSSTGFLIFNSNHPLLMEVIGNDYYNLILAINSAK